MTKSISFENLEIKYKLSSDFNDKKWKVFFFFHLEHLNTKMTPLPLKIKLI